MSLKNRSHLRWRAAGIAVCLVLALIAVLAGEARAHTRVAVGPYALILGWASEPPVVGLHNALSLEVLEGERPVEGLEGSLELSLLYGGRTRSLNLSPTGQPGLYRAELVPTVRGQYSARVQGTIGETPVDERIEPEEVLPARVLEFPESRPDPRDLLASLEELQAQIRLTTFLAAGGVLVGLAGLGVAIWSLRRADT